MTPNRLVNLFDALDAGVPLSQAPTPAVSKERENKLRSPYSISIALVEDRRMLADEIAHGLTAEGMTVVGRMTKAADVTGGEVSAEPDVVLMECELPDGDSDTATRQAKSRWPGAKVLLLAPFGSTLLLADVLRAGATGYVCRLAPIAELAVAVRAARDGSVALTPALAKKLLSMERGQRATA
jgi:two-component system response regulator DesR